MLLRAAPALDARWEDQPAHFWIVLAAGVLNAGLALAISEAGRRRRDARLLLIGLAFLASAGFLGLHALATPGVLLEKGNAGFVLATPVGLVVAGAFAAASAVEYPLGPRWRSSATPALLARRRARADRRVGGPLAGRAAAAASAVAPEDVEAPLGAFAAVGVVAYGYAALRVLPDLRRAAARGWPSRSRSRSRCWPRRS